MKKIFLVRAHTGASEGHELEADEVIEINPDIIICWCTQEVEYEHVFGKFFDKLEKWLHENDKVINLITPHLNGVFVRPRVLAENSCGYLFDYVFGLLRDVDCLKLISFDPFSNTKNIEKLYSCYINNCTSYRGKLVDHIVKEKLLDCGVVTFKYPDRYNWTWHDGSRLYDEDDFTLHENGYYPTKFPKKFFTTFFDVVVESRQNPGEFFITEKTLKSIMALKPFIAYSCKGFQKDYLENFLGLKPYDEVFDYSFDNEFSIDKRIDGILTNIKSLKDYNITELQKLYNTLIPKLIYNRNKIIDTFFDKEKIMPKSGRFFIDGTRYELYSKFPPHEFTMACELGWTK